MPSITDRPKSKSRPTQAPSVPQPRVADIRVKATTACSSRQAAMMRPRCKRSAACPATKVSKSAGANWYKPTSPKSQALPVSSYICQPTATISICWPAVLLKRASHMRMKFLSRNRSEKRWSGMERHFSRLTVGTGCR